MGVPLPWSFEVFAGLAGSEVFAGFEIFAVFAGFKASQFRRLWRL